MAVNVRITPANNNDVEPMVEILKDIEKRLGKKPKYMGMDAGCHNAPVYHQLAEADIQLVVFRKIPCHLWSNQKCLSVSQGRELTWCTTNREGYREYWSEPKTCKECPQAGEMLLRQIQQKAGDAPCMVECIGADGRVYEDRQRQMYLCLSQGNH